MSLVRGANIGKLTTTEELASRCTLRHGEHGIGCFTNG